MAAELWEWITPANQIYRLDADVDHVQIVESVTGRFMPSLRRTDEVVPLQAGQRLRSVLHDQRELTLDLFFSAVGASQLRDTLRAWMTRFDPTRGDGRLRVTDPSGNQRELTCRYQDGLELVEEPGWRVEQVASVTFEASDPYWADPVPTVVSWQTGTPRHFFPILPLRLGSSQVFVQAVIDPQSDVATYPVWTISGPGSELVLRNVTTGRILAWSGSLGIGEQLTIDTRPGNQSASPKSVYLSDSSNQFGMLTAWDFWAFVPGSNEIAVEMTGATTESAVSVSWNSRFLAA